MKAEELTACVARVEDAGGRTMGTGFLVTPSLVVTCAHVIEDAGAGPGDRVRLAFHAGGEPVEAEVLPDGWHPGEDVAFLRVVGTSPEGTHPATLGPAQGSNGHPYQALGYPRDGPVLARWPQAKIGGLVPVQGWPIPLLQVQGAEVDKGLSGAPVLDTVTGHVVGMLTGYRDVKRSDKEGAPEVRYAYAIPAETLRDLWPETLELHAPLEKPGEPPDARGISTGDVAQSILVTGDRNVVIQHLTVGIRRLPTDYTTCINNFLTHYLGRPGEPPVPFGGREAALRALDAWLEEGTPYLLLTAPAGRGKSALLVRWLERLQDRDDLLPVFVPISVRFRTNLQTVVFAALAARLAHAFGKPVPGDPNTPAEVWRGMVSSYLDRTPPEGKRLLVVVDGVDEAADWEIGADLLKVVVSGRLTATRPTPAAYRRALAWESPALAAEMDLEPLDRAGVADVLERMGVPLDQLARDVDLVAELHRLSEGNPLLVNLYVQDLWEQREGAARLRAEDLRTIRPGYEGYFDR